MPGFWFGFVLSAEFAFNTRIAARRRTDADVSGLVSSVRTASSARSVISASCFITDLILRGVSAWGTVVRRKLLI